jgi:hypothetical protein
MTERGLHIVDHRTSEAGLRSRLAQLSGPTQGWLVVSVAPRPQTKRNRLGPLVEDFANALGKSSKVGGSMRNDQERWSDVLAWVIAEDVRHVALHEAHRADGRVWNRAISLAAEAGAELWLLVDKSELTRTQMYARARSELRWTDIQALAAELPSPTATPTPPSWPELPDAHFATFAWQAREVLPANEFARVRDEYVATAQATHEWASGGAELRSADVAEFVLRLLAETPETAQAVVRVKAVQAALLLQGWRCNVRLSRLLGFRDASATLTAEVAARLRQYLRAHYAATAVLSLLTGAPLAAIADTLLGDIAPDGASVRVGGRRWAVPEYARSVIRAQRLQRMMEGARDEHSFLSVDRDDPSTPVRPGGVQAALSTVTHRCGVPVARHWSPRASESPQATLWRHGVVVERLETDVR